MKRPKSSQTNLSADSIVAIDINAVKSQILEVRGQMALLDRDAAALYGLETKRIIEAVRNNPDKFPGEYVITLTDGEIELLRPKISSLETGHGRGRHSKHGYKVFTEKGLYMLATILKGERAVRATLAIIETYAQVREMVRDMERLQTERDGSEGQARLLTRAGHKLAELIGDNLTTVSAKTTIELNLAVLKISHEVTRKR